MLDFSLSVITIGNIIKWPIKIFKQIFHKRKQKIDILKQLESKVNELGKQLESKEERLGKAENDVKIIKDALHNFYNAASEGKEPRLDDNIEHCFNDYSVKGIEHLKNI